MSSTTVSRPEWSSSPRPLTIAVLNNSKTSLVTGRGTPKSLLVFLDDVEVFVVQADAKARVKVAVDHAFAPVFEDAATRESAAEDLHDFERINARFRAHCEGFRDAGNGDGDEDLVARFHGLPGAEGAAQDRALAHDVKERFDGVERVFVAADHDGEGGVLRADVAAADGCIQEFDAFFCEHIPHMHGSAGRDGAHIDEDHAFVRALDNAARAQGDAFHVGRIGQHGDGDVTLFGHGFARTGGPGPFADEFVNRVSAAIVNDEVIPGGE